MLLKQLWTRFHEDHVLDLAAQCAYYFLLSLFPFLIFAITLIGFLPVQTADLFAWIEEYSPQGSLAWVEHNLAQIMNTQSTGLLSFGILFTLWSASNALNAIIRALNHAYGVRTFRTFLKARLVSITLTLSMIVVIGMAMVLLVFGEKIGQWMYEFLWLPESYIGLWEGFRLLCGFLVLALMFTILYYLGPNTKVRLTEVIPGAIFAALGWQLTSFGFSYFVNHFANFPATYGSLAGVIVLMLWFHLSAMILILGGILNALWSKEKHSLQ